MKKILMIAASFLLMSMGHAAQVDVNDEKYMLNEEQKGQVLAMIDDLNAKRAAQKGPNTSAVVREEAAKWGELGANMGRAAVGAAKEVGMAANEFVSTPLGKVTMGIVIYKVIGKDIIKFIMGFSILVFFLTTGHNFLRMKRYSGTVEYATVPTFFKLRTKQVVVKGQTNEQWAAAYTAMGIISILLGCAIVFGVMF